MSRQKAEPDSISGYSIAMSRYAIENVAWPTGDWGPLAVFIRDSRAVKAVPAVAYIELLEVVAELVDLAGDTVSDTDLLNGKVQPATKRRLENVIAKFNEECQS